MKIGMVEEPTVKVQTKQTTTTTTPAAAATTTTPTHVHLVVVRHVPTKLIPNSRA